MFFTTKTHERLQLRHMRPDSSGEPANAGVASRIAMNVSLYQTPGGECAANESRSAAGKIVAIIGTLLSVVLLMLLVKNRKQFFVSGYVNHVHTGMCDAA